MADKLRIRLVDGPEDAPTEAEVDHPLQDVYFQVLSAARRRRYHRDGSAQDGTPVFRYIGEDYSGRAFP